MKAKQLLVFFLFLLQNISFGAQRECQFDIATVHRESLSSR